MRSLTSRRGVTALELLFVLLLAVACATAMHAMVVLAARQSTAAVRRMAAGRDLVAVWALAQHDLAHAATSDVTVSGSSALEFDRPVGEGPACADQPTGARLRTDRAWLTRQPSAGRDQLLLRDPQVAGGWARRGIVSVAVANCPDGGPALWLGTDAAIGPVAMIRIVEPVRLRSYSSQGVHALGLEGRWGLATIQPLAGPLDTGAFEVVRNGEVLRLSLSRAPLLPLHLHVPLAPLP